MRAHRSSSASTRQRGVALYVVAVVLMLAMLLALWASRTALLLERLAHNSADYQRAFEAAQAMLEDAQQDIALHLSAHATATARSPHTLAFPRTAQDWHTWAQAVQSLPPPHCAYGLCLRRAQGMDFWNNHSALLQMLATGARYGSYTGSSGSQHPTLSIQTPQQGAWYWIEPFLLDPAHPASCTHPAATATCIQAELGFRITALALGLKGNITSTGRSSTMAVLQSVVAAHQQQAANATPPAVAPNGHVLRTLSWRQMQ